MKKLLTLLLCLLLAISCFSCSPAPDLSSVSGGYILVGEEKVVPEYVLSIGEEKIGFDEFRYYFLNNADSMADGQADPAAFWTEEKLTELMKMTLDFICVAKSMNSYAAQKGLGLTADEKNAVDSYVDSIKEHLGDKMNTHLTTLHLTEKLYRRLQQEEKIYEKVYAKLFEDGGELAWTNEEYLDYYHKNYLCATHILIDFLPGEDEKNCTKTLEEAQKIFELTATADFNSLIKEYGKDENLENFPTGYYFKEGDMVDSFYQAAKALEVGGISQPVVTKEGVHIIKRLEPDKEQVALQKEDILWGSASALDGVPQGIYTELFEEFYTKLAKDYQKDVVYNPQVEAYLKPSLVF